MTTHSLYGRGPSYPFRRVGSDLFVEEGLDLIAASIEQIVKTQKGELPWLQDFGTNLDTFRHRPMDEGLLAEASEDVVSALQKYEPRAEIREVDVQKLDKPKQGFTIRIVWAPLAKPGDLNTVIVDNEQLTEVQI